MADLENISFASAGTFARDGQPASSLAISVLSEIGINLSSHRSAALTQKKLNDSALVVTMALSHKSAVLALAPDAESKVILLGALDAEKKNPDVKDPIGGDREVYIGVRDEIEYLINILKDYIVERFKLGGDNIG